MATLNSLIETVKQGRAAKLATASLERLTETSLPAHLNEVNMVRGGAKRGALCARDSKAGAGPARVRAGARQGRLLL